MFAIIGILVVLGAVVGGYLMEHGHLAVLMQPAGAAHYWRRGGRHRPDRQPAAHPEKNCWRAGGRVHRARSSPSSAIWTR